jgi:hypothetical protein
MLLLGAVVSAPDVVMAHGVPDARRPPADGAAAVLTARAVPAHEPIVLDGRLDEPDWARAPAIRDLRQIEPVQGAAPFVETEFRILYDRRHLYIGAEVRDPEGRAGLRVPELRRNFGYFENDLVGIALDGFGDGRSAVAFQVNPHGALRDLRVFDGQYFDREWQGLWDARTLIHDEGWSVEIRIPWSTLRYDPGAPAWRLILVRRTRRLNEEVGWPEWPRQNNAYTMRYAGRLEGLEPPPPARNLQAQPYATARDERGAASGPARAVQFGGDLKWAITPNTVLDLTANTDFAEADVDRQVVNLTRFSVFFPEQRAFFLENAGLFRLVDGSWVEPFFSRRIGLDADGSPLTVPAGVRLTHQTPTRSAGALVVRQDGASGLDGSTFAVGRFQQNVGTQHRVGGLVVSRVDDRAGGGQAVNTVGAVDWFTRPTPTAWFRGMVSGSSDTDRGDGWSVFLHGANSASWGYVGWIQSVISPGYVPRTGFIPREDLITTSPAATLDLRPSWLPDAVLALRPGFTALVYHRASDRAFQEGRVTVRPLVLGLRDGGEVSVRWEPNAQRLDRPFTPLPGLSVAPGDYRYQRYGVTVRTDPSASYSVLAGWTGGGFFDGTLDELELSLQGGPSPRLRGGVGYRRNRIASLGPAGGSATTHLVVPQVRVSFDPRTQVSAFYQHNTATGRATVNARFSWEFAPLSFLHVVLNEGRDIDATLPDRSLLPGRPRDRQLVVKLTYLWQL